MMMISHHKMGDYGNGPDRVIVYILTHKRHKRHRYHQFNHWLSKSLLLNSDGSRSREQAPVHVPPSADEESAA